MGSRACLRQDRHCSAWILSQRVVKTSHARGILISNIQRAAEDAPEHCHRQSFLCHDYFRCPVRHHLAAYESMARDHVRIIGHFFRPSGWSLSTPCIRRVMDKKKKIGGGGFFKKKKKKKKKK